MKAIEIYYKIRAIVEPHYSYSDQMMAIAKWIESEFEYKPYKSKTDVNSNLFKACLTAKAMYEAQGINENSRIGGEQYRELLAAIKKSTE